MVALNSRCWEPYTKRAEAAQDTCDYKTVTAVLDEAVASGCDHPQITWRLGRNFYDHAKELPEAKKAEREQYFRKGYDLVCRSVDEDASNFASHKWKGILLGAIGDYLPVKQKIANTYKIRENFQEAIRLNPNDGTSLHCMGMWCATIRNITWVERKAASILFQSDPPTCSFEEARDYFLRSSSSKDGDTVHNSIALGDLFVSAKQNKDAKIWYENAAALPVETENQRRQQAEALTKAAKL